jgi:hypothetical protein
MTDATTDAAVETTALAPQNDAPLAPAAAAVAIPAAAHAEAKGIFASLTEKLVNFEHALAADAKAELEKLATLLHL